MRAAAIIQARMGSTRFPGKVLAPLAGKPVLWHVVHRLRQCRRLQLVALTTSDRPADDELVRFARELGVPAFRGPEDDVLARYAMAADALEPDIIVRVTGDAPLVDPRMVDRMIAALETSGAGFCTVAPGAPCLHEGIDPFTRGALQKLVGEAANDFGAREHVVAYFKQHPEFVGTTYVSVPEEEQFIGARVSVDTPSDLRFLEAVYAELSAEPGEIAVTDVVALLRRRPELLLLNATVRQKQANERSLRALIRCDGGWRVGMGHVVRCLALADELRARHGVGITFAMVEDDVGSERVRREGHALERKPYGDESEGRWLERVVRTVGPDVLIMDLRTDLDRRRVEQWRADGVLIVTLDDPSDRRLAADLAFYPPVPQVKAMDWSGFTGALYCGWEWVILRRQFSESRAKGRGDDTSTVARSSERVPDDPPVVLMTMGGSDPESLTLKAMAAVQALDADLRAIIVVGAGFRHDEQLERMLAAADQSFEVHRGVNDMAALMSRADMAVASFGTTAYELAAMGVPGIYLCLTEDHAAAAAVFEESRIGLSLGVHWKVTETQIRETIRSMMEDRRETALMRQRAQALPIGCGCRAVAAVVAAKLTEATRPTEVQSIATHD